MLGILARMTQILCGDVEAFIQSLLLFASGVGNVHLMRRFLLVFVRENRTLRYVLGRGLAGALGVPSRFPSIFFHSIFVMMYNEYEGRSLYRRPHRFCLSTPALDAAFG